MSKWNIKYDKAMTMKDILSNIAKSKSIEKGKMSEFIHCMQKPHSYKLLNNIQEAVEKLSNYKNICIIGDYDCDGVCATAILYIGLKSLGYNISYVLPLRQDGYGISKKTVDEAISKKAECIITVDNGISGKEAITYAQNNNIDVIVTDHHMPTNNIPDCLIVDPQTDDYPFKQICGAMVAYKFLQAVYDYENKDMDTAMNDELIVLASIATIADVMDLLDENRYYVSYSLPLIRNTKNIGLTALANKLDVSTFTAETVAFQIAPVINSAGRLSTPYIALQLLLEEDINEAERLADKLIALNEHRKSYQKDIVDNLDANNLTDPFIILELKNAAHGLLGIVAGMIAEKYQRPCFVFNNENEKLTGSGRSIRGYSLISVIDKAKHIATGGGHKGAAGIKLAKANIDEFKNICNEDFKKWLKTHHIVKAESEINILCPIDFSIIDRRLVNNLSMLEPFGKGNEKPVFMSENCYIDSYRIVGKHANVVQFAFNNSGCDLKGIGFSNICDIMNAIDETRPVNIAYSIGLNEWPAGTFNVQLEVKDIQQNNSAVDELTW